METVAGLGEPVGLEGKRQKAAGERGARKDELMQESEGYDNDAKETAHDIAKALMIMSRLGFGPNIMRYLNGNFGSIFGGLPSISGILGGLRPGL